MKIKVSSKTVSFVISFLIFLAIGILAITFLGNNNFVEPISYDDYSVIEYSEHEDWTDISIETGVSEESSASQTEDLSSEIDLLDQINQINNSYNCTDVLTDEMFSDETGINIKELLFLKNYSPENVSLSLGYIFVDDKIFNTNGDDLTEQLKGYTFTNSKDEKGNVLFEKEGKYFYFSKGTINPSEAKSFVKVPSYLTLSDETPVLFQSGEKWGAKNKNDKIVVKALYTHPYGFYEGIGCFASKTYVLYVYNSSGDLISSGYTVPEESKDFIRFYQGITFVKKGQKGVILKSSGKLLDTPSDFNVLGCSDGIILLEKDNKTGYMDKNGQWICEPVFVSKTFFTEGLCVVNDGRYFVIDTKGNVILPKGFDYISDFSNGQCLLYSKNHGWFLANKYII